MIKNSGNGRARWIVVGLAVGGLIFNSGILYNDVRHLKEEVADVKQDVKDLRTLMMEMMK